MSILVHIGFAKTGTSFLQNRVFSDPEKGYVQPWRRSGATAEFLVLAHPADFDPAVVRARFDKDAANAPDTLVRVISHEGLSGNARHDWRVTHHVAHRIRMAFPEARVLITIREQKSLIYSLYNQFVRSGYAVTLDEFVKTRSEGYRSACKYDNYLYDRVVEQYFDVMGKERVLVAPFEIFRADPARFEAMVHSFAGSHASPMGRYPRDNPSIGPVGLEIVRRCNRILRRPDGAERREGAGAAYRLMLAAATRVDRLAPKQINRAREARMKALIAERLGGHYAASNRRLADLTGLPLQALGYET